MYFHFVLYAAVFVTARTDSVFREYKLFMQDMTVKSSLLEQSCPNGELANIDFKIGYSYADRVQCMFHLNPLVPVEWTEEVKTLVMFADNARHKYTECIKSQTCEEINLNEWKFLAKSYYQACKFCDFINFSKQCEYDTVTLEDNPRKLNSILDSIFLYVTFSCNITLNQGVGHIQAYLNQTDESTFTMYLEKEVECESDRLPTLVTMVEQVQGIKYVTGESMNMYLAELVNNLLREKQSKQGLSASKSLFKRWGGYSEGMQERNAEYPYAIDIFYVCTEANFYKIGSSNHSTTMNKNRTEYLGGNSSYFNEQYITNGNGQWSSNQNVIIVLCVCLPVCLLIFVFSAVFFARTKHCKQKLNLKSPSCIYKC